MRVLFVVVVVYRRSVQKLRVAGSTKDSVGYTSCHDSVSYLLKQMLQKWHVIQLLMAQVDRF